MEDSNQQSLDRFTPHSYPDADNGAIEIHNMTEQSSFPVYETVSSASPFPDEAISGALRNNQDMLSTTEISGGFSSCRGNWVEHSNYFDDNDLCVNWVMYNDSSLMFPLPEYGFDSWMAFKQFTPLSDPQYRVTNGGQRFSPHQTHVTPPYNQHAVLPAPFHVTYVPAASHTEFIPSGSGSQENFINRAYSGPGSFSRGDHSRNSVSDQYKFTREYGPKEPLPNGPSALGTSRFISPSSSGSAYPLPIYIRSNEQNFAKGFGSTVNSSPWHEAYQRNVGSSSNRNQFAKDKGGIRGRDMNTVSISADALGSSGNRNRGPRDSKPKGTSLLDKDSISDIKDDESTSVFCANIFNLQDFKTDYEHAKFFVIKSFNEDNIHKSIKYNVWASTKLGNKKLDAAYRGVKEMEGSCPLILFFSVNGSGQFCGVAEMVGPVDFKNDADCWDRWSGQFPVKWHIVKDVPNSLFRGIRLENNGKNCVTWSRDSQEVELEHGIEMIKIFKNHDAKTCILDDFNFYERREKVFRERKEKQRSSSTVNTPASPATEPINQLSDNLADTLNLDCGESPFSRLIWE